MKSCARVAETPLLTFVALCILCILFDGACRPALDDDASLVTSPRILAVRAEPAEAKPNDKVTLIALYTDGVRAIDDANAGWTFCNTRRALADPDPIDPACLTADIPSEGVGARVTLAMPSEACRTFGPDRPLATKPGEPSGRPADPDGTGGFFQPGIVRAPSAAPSTFELRIRCALPDATQDIATAYEQRYTSNINPEIDALSLLDEAGHETPIDPAIATLEATRGQVIHLRAAWLASSAENYVSYDTATATLIDRRESIVVSWLSTFGAFDAARTGRDESDHATSSDNTWTAPTDGGAVTDDDDGTLFIVLRDSRGGSAFRAVSMHLH